MTYFRCSEKMDCFIAAKPNEMRQIYVACYTSFNTFVELL